MSRKPIPFPKVETDFRALAGGLDLVSPRLTMDPGKCFDAQNYECVTVGGYRRINGYERYDGRPSPTAASYWTLPATITGTVSVGATLTGGTSAATGRVLVVSGSIIVLGRVTGTFQNAEALKISGVTVATATNTAEPRGAVQPSDDADWRLLAANDLRADIGAVPGSGPIRGVFVQNEITYAFRDTVDGVNSILWKSTGSGWVQAPLGGVLQVTPYSNNSTATTISWTSENPAVLTWAVHGLSNGDAVQFTAITGSVPAGITAGATYYVKNKTSDTFEITSDPVVNTSVVITTLGAGTQHCTLVGHWDAVNAVFASNEVKVGDVFTGAVSGAYGTVRTVVLQSGAWGSGSFRAMVALASITGTFAADRLGGNGRNVGAFSVTSQIRFAGGTVETVSANFSGSSGTRRTYGADGVNQAFEYDGAVYVPIATGMTYDTPTHVLEFRNYLFLAFAGGSVQFSALGIPYTWTLVLGAGEIGVGAEITGFAQLAATQTAAAMGIFTSGKQYTLYGTSAANFVMVPSNSDIGFAAHTIQQVSNNTYGLSSRGLQSLMTTLNYGDFEFAALSFFVQPLINAKTGTATASVALKNKNQYRLFFGDGTAIAVGLTGEKIAGIMPLNYGKVVRCITNVTLASGQEVTYFGSDDGYVYLDNVGTSFDGGAIEAWVRPAFNNLKSPRVRKQYRRGVFEVDCEGYSQVNIGYDLGYANPDVNPPATQADQKISQKVNITGAGGYWDQFTWNRFVWDTPLVSGADISLDGTENNIAFLVYSDRAQDDPHTLQGVNLLYSYRRLVRSGS